MIWLPRRVLLFTTLPMLFSGVSAQGALWGGYIIGLPDEAAKVALYSLRRGHDLSALISGSPPSPNDGAIFRLSEGAITAGDSFTIVPHLGRAEREMASLALSEMFNMFSEADPSVTSSLTISPEDAQAYLPLFFAEDNQGKMLCQVIPISGYDDQPTLLFVEATSVRGAISGNEVDIEFAQGLNSMIRASGDNPIIEGTTESPEQWACHE